MVAEKDTFAFFAFTFPKSDFRDSYRIFAFHIRFSRLISDFGVSYRILGSQVRFTHHFSKSYFRASNHWIVISYFSFSLFVPQGGAVLTNGCGSPPSATAT